MADFAQSTRSPTDLMRNLARESSNEVEVIGSIMVVNLKAEVEAAIRPYRYSNAVPPFTVAELMVMAWVCRSSRSSRSITDEKIHAWISLTFGYYRSMALAQLYEHAFTPSHIQKTTFREFSYQRVLQVERMDVPLKLYRNTKGDTRLRSNNASSRRFLRRALKNEMPQFSRFLELPAEIRMMIYEETFSSGVTALQYADTEFQTLSSTYHKRLSAQFLRPDESFTSLWPLKLNQDPRYRDAIVKWATEPTSEIMALVRVNRQVFEEAMPVFYSIHTFHVDNLHELADMLLHCGPRRREHFTSISMNYSSKYTDRVGPKTANRAFRLLKDVKCLRSLKIEVSDKDFLEGVSGAPARCELVEKIPGMKILRDVRVRKLKFRFSCPRIESYLRPRMLKKAGEDENPDEKPKRATKSRKTVKEDKGVADDGEEN